MTRETVTTLGEYFVFSDLICCINYERGVLPEHIIGYETKKKRVEVISTTYGINIWDKNDT